MAVTAFILCGGLGTRLRPVTGELPKGLVPVAGKPFLHHMLGYLREQGVRDVVLGTGYGADQTEASCGDGTRWGMRVQYSPEEQPLGTAGAIKHAGPLLASDPFLALNGDSLLRFSLDRLVRTHAGKAARITIVLVAVPDKGRFGSVGLDDDGAVTGFHEKGSEGTGLINAGVYLIERSVLDTIPAGRSVSIEREVFPRFVGKGLYGIVAPGPFLDIGTPESYARAEEFLGQWGATDTA